MLKILHITSEEGVSGVPGYAEILKNKIIYRVPVRNIFLLYIPPKNREAVIHYEDTIKRKVAANRVYPYVSHNLRSQIDNVFNGADMAIWGSRDTSANRSKFERMRSGDEILIVEGGIVRLLGKTATTTVNPDLSRELWKNIHGGTTEGWDLIYFIANPVEIDLPFTDFCRLFGYDEGYQLRGFTTVGPERLDRFYATYDDLYSVLIRLKRGDTVLPKSTDQLRADNALGERDSRMELDPEFMDEVLSSDRISEHVRMQWQLLRLGLKCGSKVWVPRSDQKKIRDEYTYSDFEADFQAGLDTETRYVENIDVIWKEQYRINAAFEIENSTAIYSGLLRFADLSLVAPNTLYPLLIVAPIEKRDRLIKQIKRPVFSHLRMDSKVRYLSYEAVDEIDAFARNMDKGLNVELVVGKSESLLPN